jgi:hypothetical protein
VTSSWLQRTFLSATLIGAAPPTALAADREPGEQREAGRVQRARVERDDAPHGLSPRRWRAEGERAVDPPAAPQDVKASPPNAAAPTASTAEVHAPRAADEAAASATAAPEKEHKDRKLVMEIGIRARRMSVPKGILNSWYSNADTTGWPLPGQDRPLIEGWAYGLEWVFKKDHTNGFIWFDFVDSTMDEGYWDDLNEEPPNRRDGDYIVPRKNLGLVTFGGDYAYEVDMVRLDQTKQAFGLSFLVGAGVGLGVMVGEIDEWSQGIDGTPSYELYAAGEPAQTEKKVPRIYPIVDVNLGLRFNFGDRVVLRVEGGVHTLLYYGASLGFRF